MDKLRNKINCAVTPSCTGHSQSMASMCISFAPPCIATHISIEGDYLVHGKPASNHTSISTDLKASFIGDYILIFHSDNHNDCVFWYFPHRHLIICKAVDICSGWPFRLERNVRAGFSRCADMISVCSAISGCENIHLERDVPCRCLTTVRHLIFDEHPAACIKPYFGKIHEKVSAGGTLSHQDGLFSGVSAPLGFLKRPGNEVEAQSSYQCRNNRNYDHPPSRITHTSLSNKVEELKRGRTDNRRVFRTRYSYKCGRQHQTRNKTDAKCDPKPAGRVSQLANASPFHFKPHESPRQSKAWHHHRRQQLVRSCKSAAGGYK